MVINAVIGHCETQRLGREIIILQSKTIYLSTENRYDIITIEMVYITDDWVSHII